MKISRPLLFTLIFLSCIFLVKIVFLPLWEWRDEQILALSQARNKISRMERLLVRAPVYEARIKSARELNRKLSGLCFPAAGGGDKMQLEMQQALDRLTAAAKVEVLSTKWYKSLRDRGIWQASVEIRGQGSTRALCALVAAIENHRPFFKIVSLSLASPKRARQVKMRIVLQGFGVIEGE